MNVNPKLTRSGLAVAVLFLFACSPPTDEAASTSEAVTQDTAVTEEAPIMVEYLFVQHSQTVTLADGVLTLDNVGETVLYFSDRPHRIVGRESLEEFIEAWDDGEGSFQEIPPNAILTVVRDSVALDLAVVLKNPVLTERTLTYEVDVLDGPEAGTGTEAALFIDAFGKELGGPGKRGGEPGIPGGEPGRPGGEPGLRGGEPGIPGAEPGRPGREPGLRGGEPGIPGAEPGIPGAEPGIGGKIGKGIRGIGRHARRGARFFHRGVDQGFDRVDQGLDRVL